MEADFNERLRQHPGPVVVDFWAPWCGPCRAIEPALQRLSETYAGRVAVWRINADQEPETLRQLNIYGIPTLLVFHQGAEIARHTGATSQAALAGLFEAAISGVEPAAVGMSALDRGLRLLAGTALFAIAYGNHFAGLQLLVAGLGVAVAFSAVHDRCPIYRAVSGRVKAWLRREEPGPSPSQ